MASPRHILSPPRVRLTANSSAVVSQRRSRGELLDTMREWASQSGPDPLRLCEHLRLRRRQMERIRALVKGHGARDAAALPSASSSRNAMPPWKGRYGPNSSPLAQATGVMHRRYGSAPGWPDVSSDGGHQVEDGVETRSTPGRCEEPPW